MKKEQVNALAYARSFEYIMRRVFGFNKEEAGGMANAKFIKRDPYTAIVATCMYIYTKADCDKKREIELFLDDVRHHFQFDFDTLLSFESSKKEIGGVCYTLNYANGERAIKHLEERFRHICLN